MTAPRSNPSPSPRLVMTASEVREALGISESLCRRLTIEGRIPHVRLGRRVVYSRARILALADAPESLMAGDR
jgi:excisionase family DNA binding protein